jgi:hypothetical protein
MACAGCAKRRQQIADAIKAANDAILKLLREKPKEIKKDESNN